MANAGTFTQNLSADSIKAAAAQRVRGRDPADKRVFDRLTNLVSALLDVPVSLLLVSDADQLLFGSYHGPDGVLAGIEEFPLSQAYCQHAIGSRAAFAVEDSRVDPLVCDLMPTTELGVVAYLGVPLLTLSGEPIGILCAIDFAPRKWREHDIRVVEDLAATVMAYIEERPVESETPLSNGLNIAAVSKRTGIAADTLRKWERRYGVLRPRRTAGGQRRYDELDVSRVEWLRDRLAEGFRIGAAAGLLEPSQGETAETVDELRDALVAAAHGADPAALRGLVDQAFTLHPFAAVIEEIVAPALGTVSEEWTSDAGLIGDEHLLSEIVRSRLERMLSDGRAGIRGKAVLTCAPGERHELGLLALAVMLQSDGWLIAYLGADSPVESALSLARRLDADVVCVSVTMPEALAQLTAELEASPAGGPVVVAGGAALTHAPKLSARIVTGSLEDVVTKLRVA